MRSRSAISILLLAIAASACKEPPSYRARWDVGIAGDPVVVGCIDASDAALDSACECSERGLGDIRLVTRDELGVVVDVRTRSCFPSGFASESGRVAGPSLSPGEYAVEARGIKRQRGVGFALAAVDYTLVWGEDQLGERDANGDLLQRRCTPVADDVGCVEGAIACDCATLTVEDDETHDLDGFAIGAPPQCDNGVDDDLDGLVDGADPACGLGPDANESAEVGAAQVQIDVAFFDHNPNVGCTDLGVSALKASLFSGTCADKIEGAVATSATDLACVVGFSFFSLSAAAGSHCLEMVAVDAGGAAITIAEPFDIELAGGPAGFFQGAVDFEAADFTPAIEKRSILTLELDDGTGSPRGCVAPPLPSITSVEVEVLDAHGGMAVPVTDFEGVPLDGTGMPCPEKLQTELLTWGGYVVRVDALVDGEVCFSTGEQPVPLAPGDLVVVVPVVEPLPSVCSG